jgi:hypothetical protein
MLTDNTRNTLLPLLLLLLLLEEDEPSGAAFSTVTKSCGPRFFAFLDCSASPLELAIGLCFRAGTTVRS